MPIALAQHPLGDLPRQNQLARRYLFREGRHERPESSPHVHRALGFEHAIRMLNGIGVDLQLLGELPCSRKRLLRPEYANGNTPLDLVGYLSKDRAGIVGIEIEAEHVRILAR